MKHDILTTPTPSTAEHDWDGKTDTDRMIDAIRTPDVPLRRNMGRRILDKIQRKPGDVVSLDDPKSAMFTDDAWKGNSQDTLATMTLERDALSMADADHNAWNAGENVNETSNVLAQERNTLAKLRHDAAPLNFAESPEGYAARQRALQKAEEQAAYVSRLEQKDAEARLTHQEAGHAAFQTEENARFYEQVQLEGRKADAASRTLKERVKALNPRERKQRKEAEAWLNAQAEAQRAQGTDSNDW